MGQGVPMTKGVSLLSLRAYLEKAHGADAWGRVLGAMPPEHAQIAGGIVLASQWYPSATSEATINAMVELFGPDESLRSGEFAADFELNAVYRFLLRFTSPIWMIERGARVWSSYHSTGRWTIVGEGRSLTGTLEDFAIVNAHYCRGLTGWFRRAGQLTGAKDMQMEHPRCRAAGAQSCVFVGRW